jgi:hypothetical protein
MIRSTRSGWTFVSAPDTALLKLGLCRRARESLWPTATRLTPLSPGRCFPLGEEIWTQTKRSELYLLTVARKRSQLRNILLNLPVLVLSLARLPSKAVGLSRVNRAKRSA